MRAARLLSVTIAVLALSALPAAASLVVNQGFETGDFTGWTVAGYDAPCPDDGICGVSSPTDPNFPIPVNSGNYAAYFTSTFDSTNEDTFIGQKLALSPSTTYTLTFSLDQYLFNPDPTHGYTNFFGVYFDGSTTAGNLTGAQQLFAQNNALVSNGYQQFNLTFSTAASGNSDELQFVFYNAPGFFLIDDISVAPSSVAPEPSSFVLLLLAFACLCGMRRFVVGNPGSGDTGVNVG
jgi:hypothetical protein